MSSEQLSLTMIDQIGPALAVLGVVGVLAFFLRRGKGLPSLLSIKRAPEAQARLRVVDRVNLAPQSSICLIESGDRRWLVSSSAAGVVLLESLGSIPDMAQAAAPAEPKAAPAKPKTDAVQDALEKFDRIRRTAASVRLPAPPAPRTALTASAYLE